LHGTTLWTECLASPLGCKEIAAEGVKQVCAMTDELVNVNITGAAVPRPTKRRRPASMDGLPRWLLSSGDLPSSSADVMSCS
jgi:hypothetical protein